jgi:dihydrofolate reductase
VILALIAAVARNRVIGSNGKLPWHIPEDMRRFKRLTLEHAVLMGRGTYEALGRPLSHRRNVVVTSRTIPGVETYHTIPDALAALSGEERVFVIGGGQIYSRLLPVADELFLTWVDQSPEGDTVFPPYEHLLDTQFRLMNREDHPGYSFRDYRRLPSVK